MRITGIGNGTWYPGEHITVPCTSAVITMGICHKLVTCFRKPFQGTVRQILLESRLALRALLGTALVRYGMPGYAEQNWC